jgi:hypothetical protein
MPFINLTPHTVNCHEGNEVHNFPPTGKSLRVSGTPVPVGSHEGITIFGVEYGDLEMVDNATKDVSHDIPPVVSGTVYIVAGACADKITAMGRKDFVSPGDLLRDDKGQPIGCKGFKRIN